MTGRRRIAIAVGIVVALVIGLRVLDDATRPPGGHSSSSFATAPDGVAAYDSLLARAGHPVDRSRASIGSARLDPGSTLMLFDPGTLGEQEIVRLRSFVERGGRLVAGGLQGEAATRLLGSTVRVASRGADHSTTIALVPETVGVRDVRAVGADAYSATGTALPVLGRGDATLLAVATVGRGRIALLADTSPLTNQLLGEGDDAALGLGLAGPANRPIVFVESVHGYGRASGLSALPTGWRVALAGLFVASLVMMVARGRRLGPPERADRPVAPSRREHVDAVAATLRRTHKPDEAAAPLRDALRARLGEHDADAAMGSARGEQALIDAAAALARLEGAGSLRSRGGGADEGTA